MSLYNLDDLLLTKISNQSRCPQFCSNKCFAEAFQEVTFLQLSQIKLNLACKCPVLVYFSVGNDHFADKKFVPSEEFFNSNYFGISDWA